MDTEPPRDPLDEHQRSFPRRLRVFVVEDHADSREMLCLLLKVLGHDYVAARSMQEALANIPSAGCDVLLTDIGLPDGSGWELLQRLQGAAPLYSLAMTGYGMNTDIEKSRAAGFRHHIVKPLGPDQLRGLLAEAAQEIANPRT